MPIRGQYHTQLQNISVDLPSHLFSDDKDVVFHEVTHYYLSAYTNEGAVYSILSENCLPPKKFIVDMAKINTACKILHEDMYLPQEGFAHLMQAMQIYDEGGDQAIKNWEDSLPHKPKSAFNYVKFAITLPQSQKEYFSTKLSDISLNTNIHLKVIENPNFLTTNDLTNFLLGANLSANERFKKVCYAIERDLTLLELTGQEICTKIGLPYYPTISNKDKALLINAITSLTDHPTSVQESDIKSLSDPNEIFLPALESMIIADLSLVRDAIVGVRESDIRDESRYFRTLFIYNNPQSPQKENHFGFYSFSRMHYIINGSLEINELSKKIIDQEELTKVVDTASFDFTKCEIKPERNFIKPNIIWHKNYHDLIPLIEMAEKMNLTIEECNFAITDGHPYRFFILRISGGKILHITAGYSFIENRLSSAKFKRTNLDFFEIIKGSEKHINNFFHDMIGMPYLFDLVEMFNDAEKHLNKAAEFKKNVSRNDICICGSGKKYKNCHGR